MHVKTVAVVVAGMAAMTALSQGRDSFVQQQAYAEMQRVSGQIDVLQNNFDDLQRRVAGIERGNATQDLQDTAGQVFFENRGKIVAADPAGNAVVFDHGLHQMEIPLHRHIPVVPADILIDHGKLL